MQRLLASWKKAATISRPSVKVNKNKKCSVKILGTIGPIGKMIK
jgi:hypothetical protein